MEHRYFVCVGVGPDFRDAYLDSPRLHAAHSTTDPVAAQSFPHDEAAYAAAQIRDAFVVEVGEVLRAEIDVAEQTLARLQHALKAMGA